MRIIFVRHGEPDYARDCLTETGREQAAAAAERLAGEGISEIYTSPCGRAAQTAAFTAERLGLPVTTLDYMHEISWGGPGVPHDGHPWTLGDLMLAEGFDFSGGLALWVLLAGYGVLFFTKSTLPVFVGSLLMMTGYLCSMAVFGASIRDNTPEGKAGRLQGVRICAQVLLPGVIGPAIGKKVLENARVIVNGDGTTSFVPNENIFLAAAIAIIPVLVYVMIRAKGKKTENAK